MSFAAGQQWAYAAPPELSDSRIHIGAIVEFEGGRRIACCSVSHAIEKRSDGSLERVTIPFLPITLEALAQTVTALDGVAALPDEFGKHLAAWSNDARGATYFTVPFEGSLDRMIGLQMASIIEQP